MPRLRTAALVVLAAVAGPTSAVALAGEQEETPKLSLTAPRTVTVGELVTVTVRGLKPRERFAIDVLPVEGDGGRSVAMRRGDVDGGTRRVRFTMPRALRVAGELVRFKDRVEAYIAVDAARTERLPRRRTRVRVPESPTR